MQLPCLLKDFPLPLLLHSAVPELVLPLINAILREINRKRIRALVFSFKALSKDNSFFKCSIMSRLVFIICTWRSFGGFSQRDVSTFATTNFHHISNFVNNAAFWCWWKSNFVTITSNEKQSEAKEPVFLVS